MEYDYHGQLRTFLEGSRSGAGGLELLPQAVRLSNDDHNYLRKEAHVF